MTTTPVADSLRTARSIWQDLYPSLEASLNVQNGQIPKSALDQWFDIVVAGVAWIEEGNADPILKTIHWQGVANGTSQVVGHMNTAKQQGAAWLQQNCSNLQNFLWTIRSTLIWILPIPDENFSGPKISRAAEVNALAQEATLAFSRIEVAEKTAREKLDEMTRAQQQVAADVEKISGYERAANTAGTNAGASATAAEAEKQKINSYVADLEKAVATQQSLFNEFEEKRAFVEATLQGASRVALAKSFDDRRKLLVWFQGGWAVLFLLGIAVLVGLGLYLGADVLSKVAGSSPLLVPVNSSAPSARNYIEPAALFSILRFLILAPVVWFTWFAARQYGHAQRLAEDYSFKSAAAHAYVGYRDEMGDDDGMIKMLREYAVKNFGANPIRVLERKEPATPLSELIHGVADKVSPDKLVDLLKEAISVVKK